MIDYSEFELFLKLGGEIRYNDVIEKHHQVLKATGSFQSIPEHLPERQQILDRASLLTISQDHAYLLTLMAKTKNALNAGDIESASFYVGCAFK